METKDLLEFLDVAKDVKDLDAFKKAFSQKFITKSEAWDDDEIKGKVTGRITGSMTTVAKREFDLSSDEVKDKKWEEVIALGASKLKAKLKELEETAATGNDEKVKTLTEKLDKVQKSANDYKTLLDTTKQTLTEKETEFTGKIKGFKVKSVLDKAKEKVSAKLKSDMSEAEKFYFDSKINESIVIDFDDKDEVIVLGKDGKRLPSTKTAGAFLNIDEAIESQAALLGLVKKNNGASVDAGKFFQQQTAAPITEPGKAVRQVHPSALKNAEKLKADSVAQ